MATVFVGIPTRNRPHYVKQALRSVCEQSFRDVRIVVSDNCSEPALLDELRAYVAALDDPRVTLVGQPVNCGHNGQLVYLFAQCHEEFFMLLDDDDILEHEFLATALDRLSENPDVALFGCDQNLIDESSTLLPEKTLSYSADLGRDRLAEGVHDGILPMVLWRGVFSFSATLFRTSVLRDCGTLDHPDVQNIDFNVYLRLAERGRKAWWCTQKLSRYRWHADQTRKRVSWEFNEAWIATYAGLLERRAFSGEAERIRRFLLAFAYRRLAYIEFVRGAYRAAYRYLVWTVQLDPFNWRAWSKVLFAALFPFLIAPLWTHKVTLRPTASVESASQVAT